ncbi:hypothetical protein C3L33_19375, partial [Rhododendron williamsianum]
MSWQTYVDEHLMCDIDGLGLHLAAASIIGLDGIRRHHYKEDRASLVFGIYEEPVTPGQCNMVVERLGDYLIDQGL